MADEFFYGVTLTSEKPETTWNPETGGDGDFPRANKLIVKQILLGVEAKENEYNVVEVEAKSEESTVKIPIAVLKVGETRCSQSFLEFPDSPVKFTLIKGTGPVHIHGHHLIAEGDNDDIEGLDDEELEDEMDDLDEEEQNDEPKSKKAKVADKPKHAKNNDKNKKK